MIFVINTDDETFKIKKIRNRPGYADEGQGRGLDWKECRQILRRHRTTHNLLLASTTKELAMVANTKKEFFIP